MRTNELINITSCGGLNINNPPINPPGVLNWFLRLMAKYSNLSYQKRKEMYKNDIDEMNMLK